MPSKLTRWLWALVWIGSILLGITIALLYGSLPADGATGDMASFVPQGFLIRWLLEPREEKLHPGDIIVTAGGHTSDDWLFGASRGSEWSDGGIVEYQIIRDNKLIIKQIQMVPVSFQSIISRWWAQLLALLGLLIIGAYVYLKRPDEIAARLLMLFYTMMALQIWGDAYNFQYAILPRRSLFWLQFLIEYGSFILIYASILHFALVFPKPHWVIERWPRLSLLIIYLVHPIILVMALSIVTPWTIALRITDRASWVIALVQGLVAISIGMRSYLTVRDPTHRAQLRWIVWGAGIIFIFLIPLYIVPSAFYNGPIISHPVVMLFTAFAIIVFAVPILRYRLFDIDIVINKSLIFGTLTILLVGIYFLLVRFLTLVTQVVSKDFDNTFVVFIATLTLAFIFNPLRMRIQAVIDRSFYRETYNYRELFSEISARLPRIIIQGGLTELLTVEIPSRLSISNSSLYLLNQEGISYKCVYPDFRSILSFDHPFVIAIHHHTTPINRLDPGYPLQEQVVEWMQEQAVELAIPLLIGDEVVGIYCLGSKMSGKTYRLEEIQLLSILGGQVAIGLQSNRLLHAEQEQRKRAEELADRMGTLLEETNRRATQLEVINAIIAVAVAAPDIDHLLESMLGLTLDTIGKGSGGVFVSGHTVNRGIPDSFMQYCLQISQGMGWVGSSTIIIDDWLVVDDEALMKWSSIMTDAGIRSSLIVPVVVGGRHSGVLTLGSHASTHWQEEDIAMVKAVVRQLGSAMERLDLLAQTQEQARQVHQIVDTVPDGVILLDERHQVVLANPAARKHLKDLVGLEKPDHPIRTFAERPIESFLDVTSEQPWRELVREGPPRLVFEIAARPLFEDSESSGWVIVLRDVTVERETQAHVQMQERLATVGQLAAGIAHDFNNIMAAIQVYVDLLSMDDGLSEQSGERLDIVQNQIGRATSLIRQILDFSRRSIMDESSMDLLPLIKELEKLLQRLLPENIHTELVYEPGSYMVKADPTRLQQVFLNLSLNARDAMPNGGLLRFKLDRLDLQAGDQFPAPDLTPGNWIQIKVVDTGTGIPDSILPHIFDPFFTTKKIGQGTGLGLAQVYGIVSGHGGSINLESQEGQGTTFMVYLPELEIEVEEVVLSEDVKNFTGSGETVLVAEDDPVTRDAIRVLLESLNYDVITAANGKEALSLYRRSKDSISLLVCDVVMPEMDGIPLYHEIKEDGDMESLRVLFVSGHPLDFEKLISREAGYVNWLQKPFSVQEFATAVRKALS